jgi:predicted component of type VI protein secretion system
MALSNSSVWHGVMLLAAGLGAGCSQKHAAAPKMETVRMRIATADDANRGTALHVLVRETSKTDYPRVDYEDGANTLLAESDPKTIDWLVVLPGQQREVVLEHPKGTAIAVYFMFTEPGQRWKQLLDDPVKQVEFLVGRDQISESRVWTADARAP